MTSQRWLGWLVAALSAALLLTLLVQHAAPTVEGPDRPAAAAMVEMVNAERVEQGVEPLVAADDIATVAEEWSAAMALAAAMDHNPAYAEQICCWSVVTENVAWAQAPRLWSPTDPVLRLTRELHEGLMSSPGHRANILDSDVDEVGIGVHVDREGSVWITQNFRRRQTG